MPRKKTDKKDIEKVDLQEALDEIKQRFGEGVIMKLSEVEAADVNVISTGSPSVDLALGVGGVPRGRVIEIFGPDYLQPIILLTGLQSYPGTDCDNINTFQQSLRSRRKRTILHLHQFISISLRREFKHV